ncbi:MAG: nucleoside deaminase, partial [Bdellovibrionota bacterium]
MWIDEALRLARSAAKLGEVPVGALVVNQEIIGRGFNKRERSNDPLAHAEMIALTSAAKKLGSWRLDGCILVATLEPCLMCLAACQQARIRKVIYGAKDPKGGAISLG